jgi:peroxiredoxin
MPNIPAPSTHAAAPPAAVEVDAADEGEEGRIGYGRFGRWTPLALAVLLVLSLFAIGIAGQRESASDADSSSGNAPTGSGNGAQIGAPAPDFDLALLDGSTLGLHDLHGKTVVLNFWASWCAPCKEEMPVLQRLASTSGDDVAIVGVGLRNDEDAAARAFITQTGVTFPTGRDTGPPASGPRGPIEMAYGVLAAPTTIVIAPDGTIANIALGPQTEEQLRTLIGGRGQQ